MNDVKCIEQLNDQIKLFEAVNDVLETLRYYQQFLLN